MAKLVDVVNFGLVIPSRSDYGTIPPATEAEVNLSRRCIAHVKLFENDETTSLRCASRSLLSAPSLSILESRSDSLLFRCARKSASNCRILPTGMLSR